MNDEQLRAAYQKGMTRGRDRSACPTAEQLGAVVDGSASEAERLRVLRHVGGCADCRADLELLRTGAEIAERVMRPWWTSRPVLALAAALVVMVGGVTLWRQAGAPPGGDIVRDGPAAVVQLVTPPADGAATLPLRLVWGAATGARRYQVEVLDKAGTALFAAMTGDTVLDVPARIPLTAGAEYRYWVRALLSDGTEARSEFRRFHIATP